MGSLQLRVPRVRDGSYFPVLLEPRRRAERALVAVVQEAYVQGVSTRRVDDLVQALGIQGVSKSQVSLLCTELDAERSSASAKVPAAGQGAPAEDLPYRVALGGCDLNRRGITAMAGGDVRASTSAMTGYNRGDGASVKCRRP